MNDSILNVSWQDVEDGCLDIAHKIKLSKFSPDIILPVLWGGIIPARILMDITGWDRKIFHPILTSFYTSPQSTQKKVDINLYGLENKDIENKEILIVEEIIDSGRTISAIFEELSLLKVDSTNISIVSLFCRSDAPLPDFYYKIENGWLIFPWDKQEYMRAII